MLDKIKFLIGFVAEKFTTLGVTTADVAEFLGTLNKAVESASACYDQLDANQCSDTSAALFDQALADLHNLPAIKSSLDAIIDLSNNCYDKFGSVNNALQEIVRVANTVQKILTGPLKALVEAIKIPLDWIKEQIEAFEKAIRESPGVQCIFDVLDNMLLISDLFSCPVETVIVMAFNEGANKVAELLEEILNEVREHVAIAVIDTIIPDDIDLTLNLPDPLASLPDATIFAMCALTDGEHTSIHQIVKAKLEEKLTKALNVQFEFGQPLTLFNSNALQDTLINHVITSPIKIPRMGVENVCHDAWENFIDGPKEGGCVDIAVQKIDDHFTKPKGHGEICAAGTTCKLCAKVVLGDVVVDGYATHWAKKLGWRCGEEPKWNVGEMCAAGTTCEGSCPGGAFDYYYTLGYWACGKEPKNWPDGTYCFAGTSCTRCANGDSWWFGKGGQHCGAEPCWSPGTICGAGTTCNWECCGGQHSAPWWHFGLGYCI